MLLKYLRKQKLFSLIFAITLLTGCGGGGGGGATSSSPPPDTTQIAYFIDSAVSGVDYSCGTITGTTDSTGQFTYDSTKCDAITFKLGNLVLGSIDPLDINTTDKKVTVQELVGVARTDLNNSTVLKIATLLQSLDNDGDSTNEITLINTSGLSGDINTTSLNTIISQFNSANISNQKTLKNEDVVKAHLTDSMIKMNVLALDNTPNSFSFASQNGIERSSSISSENKIITGIDTPAIISISNGFYSINNGSWTNVTGIISNGQPVKVKHTSSANFETNTTTTLSIGSVSSTFTSRTRTADTTPDDFSFTSKDDVNPSTNITSDPITIAGIDAPASITIANGSFSINGSDTWLATGTISNGEKIRVRHTSANNFETNTTTTLTIGGVSGTFTSKTRIADTEPDNFSFTAQTEVAQSSLITSTPITITGIEAAATISIIGGEYSINGGDWKSTTGTIENNQTIRVKHTSSANFSISTTTIVTVGNISQTFRSTTLASDTTPNDFSFTAQTDVTQDSIITSNPITITGINTPTAISITNGFYRIDGGDWTNETGTIENNQSIQIRHTSSSDFESSTTTTIAIGGVVKTFRSTTLATDITPNDFSFIAQTNVAKSSSITSNLVTITGINTPTTISIIGGEYRTNNGVSWTDENRTIENNESIQVRHTSSAIFGTTTTSIVTIGSVTKTFSSTTIHSDTTPNDFTFNDEINVTRDTSITSDSITITGINAPTTISIIGGEYSINGGAWTNTISTIENNQTVQVKVTSSNSYNTPTQTTLTIGGIDSSFTVTTLKDPNNATDTTPDTNFNFTAQTDVAQNTSMTSNLVTITGINAPTTISITNGLYSINGGTWTNTAGTIENNQTVQLQHTSSANFGTTTTTTVTIGGVVKTFSSTTLASDTTPNDFNFIDKTNVEKNIALNSESVTITGINTSTSISILNGQYRINNGTWTDANGTIENNQTVQLQHTSSANFGTTTTTTVTVGGIAKTFNSTTRNAYTTPNDFTFTTQNDVERSSTITSNDANITGIEIPVSISISNGEYSINGGDWTNLDSNISNGQTVKVRHTSSSSYDTNISTTLTIGGLTNTFTSKTRKIDTTPNDFSFTNQLNITVNTLTTSNEITISGLEGASPVSISDGEYSVDDANWTTLGGTITDGQTVRVRHTSSANFGTKKTTTLSIGGVTGTFETTTEIQDITPNSFSFTDNLSVTKNTTITSDPITITGINDNVTISIVGGYYSIDGNDANWTNIASTIRNNQTVRVRHTSSKLSLTETNTILSVGGVSDTFTTKTDNAYIQAYLTSGKPVGGVQYSCGSENGTVQSDGSFTFGCTGSTITFKLATLTLGTINTDNINTDKNITLQEISGLGRDTITSSKLSKTIQLLHSLDKDKNSSNGIEIESKYLDATGTKITLNGAIESFTDEQLANEIIRVGRYPKIKFEAVNDMLKNLKTSGATIKDFATYPEANSINAGPYTLIKLGFGESMLNTTITPTNIALRKSGVSTNVTSSCNYDDTLMIATCKVQTAGLIESSVYTVTLSANIKNSENKSITSQTFSFTTGTKNIVPKLKTGQTGSYDENGIVATTLYDDGHYASTIGTARSFTRASEIVTDNGTKLLWKDDTTVTSITNNWTNTQNYCSTTYGDNWRLPTMKEFSLIADKSRGGDTPAIFSTFTNVAHIENTNAYWTSNLDPDDVNLSYAFLFYDGIDQGAAAEHNDSKVYLNIRCVNGTSPSNDPFTRDDVNRIVIDTSSGLMWQDNEIVSLRWFDSSEGSTLETAINYCENLSLGGSTDWRVPNYNELLSTLEMKYYDTTATQPVYLSPAFKYNAATSYWTSTSYSPDKTKAWTINFSTTGAISDTNDKIYPSNLRCVRGN